MDKAVGRNVAPVSVVLHRAQSDEVNKNIHENKY
jgi:hypothetical protein